MLVFITGMEILLQPLPSKGKQLAFALARVRLGVTSRERRGLYPLYTRNPFLSWKEGFAFVRNWFSAGTSPVWAPQPAVQYQLAPVGCASGQLFSNFSSNHSPSPVK